MIAAVETVDGVFRIDVETEDVIDFSGEELLPPAPEVEVPLPGVVAAAAAGATRIAIVDRRPPLVVSYDAGGLWTEAGGGLPAGRAIAIAEDDPDLVLFAARNRLYVSRDGGRFWHALAPELPEITAASLTAA